MSSIPPAEHGAAAVALASSRYSFAIPVRDGTLLYNAGSGAVIRLAGGDAGRLADPLAGPPHPIAPGEWPPELVLQLIEGGFLVPAAMDEVGIIRERYREARRRTPMTLTITTTMDCNLGCYYCYEERSGAQLEPRDIGGILRLAESRLKASGRPTLHVDWYGGEPLLNLTALETASAWSTGLPSSPTEPPGPRTWAPSWRPTRCDKSRSPSTASRPITTSAAAIGGAGLPRRVHRPSTRQPG